MHIAIKGCKKKKKRSNMCDVTFLPDQVDVSFAWYIDAS